MILCIESATDMCSVAIVEDRKVVSFREEGGRKHSEKLAVFVSEVLNESGLKVSDLDAIAISAGPGSYTGLRIGMSVAKGLCFSSDIPLISISTLEIMAARASEEIKDADANILFCPMIDAGRMEVYSALYDRQMECHHIPVPVVVTEDLFKGQVENKKVYFFGDGAVKCSEILRDNFIYHAGIFPSAINMNSLASDKFEEKKFVIPALAEPIYLKEFSATIKNQK